MAAVEKLQAEATCSICLEYFRDPVSIDCGHNFCRPCIVNCWAKPPGNFSCPQCRETIPDRNLRSNRELRNMVELVKNLRLEVAEASPAAPGEGICQRHQEPLKLFCQQDEIPICVICRESREHRPHQVLPIEEAAQEYKNQIKAEIEKLKSEREDLKTMELNDETALKDSLAKLRAEMELIVSEFEQLHKFEEEQKGLFLGQLKALQEEMEEEQKSGAVRSSEKIACLSTRIGNMEELWQQSGTTFLQDVKSILSRDTASSATPFGLHLKTYQGLGSAPGPTKRFMHVQTPVNDYEFQRKLAAYSQRNVVFKQILQNFKAELSRVVGSQMLTSHRFKPPTSSLKKNIHSLIGKQARKEKVSSSSESEATAC